MIFKVTILACMAVAAQAGGIALSAPIAYPEYSSQQSNIYRSFGNQAQISTHSKTLDTPFSSVSKSDVRISNPGYAIAAQPASIAYQAPIAYSAPIAKVAAPIAYPAPIVQAPLAYSAPIAHAPLAYSAPIAHAPVAYSAPAYSAPIAHAPLAYSAPIAKVAAPLAYSAPVSHGLIGTAYSAAPAVAHVSYTNNLGLAYQW